MNTLTQELIELLSLEKIEENVYRGISRNLVGKRVFGGQVLGQALRAASYTTDRPAHSLHAYFLYGGDVNAPILYEIDRLRDGKSFVSRQVRAIQHGRTIFTAMISFAEPEEGLNYQISEPDYPDVASLKSEAELKKHGGVCAKMSVPALCVIDILIFARLIPAIRFSHSLKHRLMRTIYAPIVPCLKI